ncbi:MAG TPA: hypothetical protein VGP65_18750 [Candidatus Angelobacter sp.]|nr:hypothetical protein [Candidatus Angelobacter sp.]
MRTISPDDTQEIARLKALYHSAINRKFQGPETQGETSDSGIEERAKRAARMAQQAKDRENQAFLERLRARLTALGVSKDELEKAAAGVAVTSLTLRKRLAKARTAILVVHGIGEQNPYETLDQFGRNLMRYLSFEGGIDDLQIEADRYDHNDSTEARIRLSTQNFGPQPNSPGLIDIYEYYWAPQTEDKISYRETLAWLIKTTLTPIRFLNENVHEISNGVERHNDSEAQPDESDEPLTKGSIFMREIRRIILIYLPLLFAVGGLLYLIPQTIKLPATVKGIFESWASTQPAAKGVMTFCFACALVLNLVVIKQLWQNWLRRKRQQPVMVVRTWVWQTFLIGLLFLAAGFGVGRLWSVSISKYFEPVRQINVLLFLLVAGFARVVQFFFKSFVGDVAVYTNADAKAKNFLVRKAILNSSTNAVIRLLQEKHVAQANDPYDQVIVAGHSLGSVIAYDTLNQLLNKRYSREDQIIGSVPEKTKVTQDELNKIRGLVTFGCPLDKVHYFFRENVPSHQAIRAQLLQFLQSFRKRPSNYDYGLYRLQRYDASGLNSVLWLNAWSRQDPVSGALHFYTGLTRRHFKYKIPIYAHLSYWEDLRFYEFFSEPLLLGNQAALKQKAMSASV